MSRTKSSKRLGAVSVLFVIATSLVNALYFKLYRHFFSEAAVETRFDRKQGHQRLEDPDTCFNNHDLEISTPQGVGRVLHGDVLLQRARKVAVGMSLENRTSPRLDLLQQAPTGDVAITVSSIVCNTEIFAPDGSCPAACPFFAQEDGKTKACYFQCVTAAECGSLNAADDIPDQAQKICRKCRVLGCKQCATGIALAQLAKPGAASRALDIPLDVPGAAISTERGDKCAVCDDGYTHNPDGTCMNNQWRTWRVIFIIAGIAIVFLASWLLRLSFLPVTNEEGLREGLAYRSSLKLRVPRTLASLDSDPQAPQSERPLWPISTNLHSIQVGGAGLTLHMNFQLALIIWASGIVVTWVVFTYFTSPDMLVLGLYPADTPQQLCAVTLKGKEVQKRLLPTKVGYMVFMYIFTILFNFGYALYQRRKFLSIDDDTSMTDFCAMISGLPEMSGDKMVEVLLKQCVEEATGEKVVGVSVCWACKEFEEELADATDQEVQMLEETPELPDQADLDDKNRGFLNNIYANVDGIFSFTGKLPEAGETQNVEDLLKKVSSTDSAFVVFENEASRDKAVAASISGISFQDCKLNLKHENCEPDTVKWSNFKVTHGEFYTKMAIGILVIFLALLAWCFGFYLPFAYYQASYAKQGAEPGFLAAFIFSMLVVAGNQIMYFLCGEVADRVGFRFNDHQEALYITLYTLACMLNLVVDMVMEFFLAYAAAVSAHTHTADGRLLEDITGYEEIFESYVMQKAVGERLFAYCFPATFFIPFLMEPLFGICFPFQICKLLLRTHPECRGREAEKAMNIFCSMDMGRYGDLLLNIMLSVLIVFFPPGTFLKMMLALVVCHIGVYVYDQYRILRCTPAFDYSSDKIDRLVQILMGVPTSFLAAGIVFKGGCLPGSSVCLEGGRLLAAMLVASGLTFLLQIILVTIVVPMFDKTDHQVSTTPYNEAAATMASTWFSENAVHCLRSKYIYKHDPPCLFNTRGKEHLIRKNEKCGVHFQGSCQVSADEYYK